jgi:cytidine deaminase
MSTSSEEEILLAAKNARSRAQRATPESAAVGAALRDSRGHVWTAASVDTPDRVVGICAEQAALFYALTNGAREFSELAISLDIGPLSTHPCGACLEALRRFAPDVSIVIEKAGIVKGPFRVQQLLPEL